jgi:hypothetical protein
MYNVHMYLNVLTRTTGSGQEYGGCLNSFSTDQTDHQQHGSVKQRRSHGDDAGVVTIFLLVLGGDKCLGGELLPV